MLADELETARTYAAETFRNVTGPLFLPKMGDCMLFMEGLDSLSRDEKLALLAQCKCHQQPQCLVRGSAQEGLKKRKKDFVFKASAFLMGRFSYVMGRRIKGRERTVGLGDVNTVQRGLLNGVKAGAIERLDEPDLMRHLLVSEWRR